jgi:hypothetical protein
MEIISELIGEEQTNTLSIAGALKNFPKDTKSELDTLLSSSPQSSSSEEVKPHYCSFENPLFLEPSSYPCSERKPLISSVEDQKLISAQLSFLPRELFLFLHHKFFLFLQFKHPL